MRDYKKIDAWRLADDLAVAVYERTRGFPKEERYGLTSHLRRAAYSVPANIAEGSSGESKRRSSPPFSGPESQVSRPPSQVSGLPSLVSIP